MGKKNARDFLINLTNVMYFFIADSTVVEKPFILRVFMCIVKTSCIPKFNSLVLKADILDNCCSKLVDILLTIAKYSFCEKIFVFKSNIHELISAYSF